MRFRNLFASLLACSLAGAAHADVIHLKCVQTGATEYQLTYEFTGDTHSVAILAGTDANKVPMSAPLLKTTEQSTTLHAGKPGERVYFYLKANSGEVREVSIRHLPLQGTPNFRDIGGYRTTDGRTVRWGLLYRSGVLGGLTPEDYQYLSRLGIRVVCDFRNQQEREVSPETWIPGSSVDQISLPIGGKPAARPAVQSPSFDPGATPEQLHDRMIQGYTYMAIDSSDQFASLFHQVENDHLPLLYHCTAGKDRTGIFSVLLLLTLGVPENTVLADYALTGEYLGSDPNSPAMQKMMKASGTSMSSAFQKLTPEQRKPMMAANPAYVEGMLRAINARYGSFDAYRRDALHVSDNDVTKLRDLLTQP
ncbi:tyrosine-protein phosphatase [Silvibacterium acidisoli]|uniref:tyrosine-protein phosphatase n=1 Tax=Acidobacteriaceae bacterium ZG23-2 TaxID=2883246 RepID=UPI00406CC4E6